MKSCLLCPRGPRCRGYILHGLLLKLDDALVRGCDAAGVAQALDGEDRRLLADYGTAARETCWSKAFVLAAGHRLAGLAADNQGAADADLRADMDRLLGRLERLFSRLPQGMAVDLDGLTLDLFNHTCRLLEGRGVEAAAIPANMIGQACSAVARADRRSRVST